jgi:hypothetical protein
MGRAGVLRDDPASCWRLRSQFAAFAASTPQLHLRGGPRAGTGKEHTPAKPIPFIAHEKLARKRIQTLGMHDTLIKASKKDRILTTPP